jgi:hypothetical protein
MLRLYHDDRQPGRAAVRDLAAGSFMTRDGAGMSTDWFLFSPAHRKGAMIGSVGLGGVKVWPTEYKGVEFLRWAIDNNVKDVVLVNEHDPRLDEVDDDGLG